MKMIPKILCTPKVKAIFLNLSRLPHTIFRRQHDDNSIRNIFLKLINDSSNLNEGNHDSNDFYHFSSLVLAGFGFQWQETSITQESFWSHFHTRKSSSKVLRCASYFQLRSRCLEIIGVKHGLSSFKFFKSVWFISSNSLAKSKPTENKLLKIYKISNHQRKN